MGTSTTIVLSLVLVVGSALFIEGARSNPVANTAVGGGGTSLLPLEHFFRNQLVSKLRPSDGDGGSGVWQSLPHLWRNVEGCDSANLFSFGDAVAASLGGLLDRASVAVADAARGGKWVSELAPSRTADDLRVALDRGTVFFNGAGLDYPALAGLASLCQDTLGLPSNVNVYITQPGREVSVSPHTDAQDVLIFQTSGTKRWKVWAPPARARGKDPFGRGKRGDRIEGAELGAPLLDTWLVPGSVLYVPIGFPHATSTEQQSGSETILCNGNQDSKSADGDYSCHVTLNIDTYFYGICFATLRAIAAARAGSPDRVDPARLDDELHARLFAPLPLGFLCPAPLQQDAYGGAFEAHVAQIVTALNREAAAACGVGAPCLGGDDAVRECVRFLVAHWRHIMTPDKYANVRPPAPLLSIEAFQNKMEKDTKNRKEEAEQKKLGAFASVRRGAMQS